ncbi:MAG: helix-turn-helix transcriptional regulator [Clostridia bacterium]|nr:helix-turn-helix transcriptional regulator [Clostridia bacterium]
MLSENIKTLRKQKGYSQEQLADKLNVVRQTVSKCEKDYFISKGGTCEIIYEEKN